MYAQLALQVVQEIVGEVAISVYDKSGGVIQDGQYIAVYHEGMQIPYGATGGVKPMPDGHTWYRGGAVVSTTLSDGTVVQASTHTFTGLVPGVTYTFIVYDANTQCTFTKEANIHVPTQSNLKITINGTASTTCADANDGKVFVKLEKTGVAGTTLLTYKVYRYIPSLIPGLLNPTIGPVGGNYPSVRVQKLMLQLQEFLQVVTLYSLPMVITVQWVAKSLL